MNDERSALLYKANLPCRMMAGETIKRFETYGWLKLC